MTSEPTFVITKNDIDYVDNNATDKNDLLSQWLNSLETRSSLFWLHYIDCNLSDEEEKQLLSSNSLESSGSTRTITTSEEDDDTPSTDIDDEFNNTTIINRENRAESNADDNDNENDDVFSAETTLSCHSIAHRESDLLVALTENCTLGPVCYFCR